MAPIISLLTDFGLRDAYVASMKGVILSLNPQAVLVDLTHDIAPQDIRAGALVLAGAAPYFPPGTIHLAVVDPGVGGRRRALAAFALGHYWVGPDNGLLHPAWRQDPGFQAVSLKNPAYFRTPVSATFHGRDIFAPVAAHLSLGVALPQLGPAVTDPVALDLPEPSFSPEMIQGEIIYVDRFGNLVTNVAERDLRTWAAGRGVRLRLGPRTIAGLFRTYTDVAPGELLLLVGSHGYLEIAGNQASAADLVVAGAGVHFDIHSID